MKYLIALLINTILVNATCLNGLQIKNTEYNKLEKQQCLMSCKMYFSENDQILFQKKTFKKPVILGASVSAGYTTKKKKGPSSHFLEAIGIPDYKNISIPGSTSDRMITSATQDKSYNDSSIKIGLDLFFWDTVKTEDCSLEHIEKKYSNEKYKSLFTGPSILATVPKINSSQKPECLKSINTVLEKLCNSNTCKLVKSFGKEFKELDSTNMNDELHPNDTGAQILGEKMCSLMML